MMILEPGATIRISREMKQDILSRNWPTWQYKTWRVGNTVIVSYVHEADVIISNPRAASTTFSREMIERAMQNRMNSYDRTC